MKREEIVEGNIYKAIFMMGWPIALSLLLQNSYGLVDMFWVGRLGANAVAAVSLVGLTFFIVFAAAQLFGSGIISIVSRAFGEKNFKKVSYSAKQGIIITGFAGILMSAFFFTLSKEIVSFIGAKGKVVPLAQGYLIWIAPGIIFQLLSFDINFSMRGTGDTIRPMIIMIIATIVNIVLDPILIFGIGPFPKMGVKGAALATVIAQIVSVLYAIYVASSQKFELKVNWKEPIKIDFNVIKTILAIGIPFGFQFVMMSVRALILMKFVSKFSMAAVASVGIVMRIIQISNLPIISIGIATTTLVGQNIGANKRNRVLESSVKAIFLNFIITSAFVLFFEIFAKPILGIFINDKTVISMGIPLMRITAGFLFFQGLTIILTSVFRGSGYSLPPLISPVIAVIALFFLALSLPPLFKEKIYGIWYAMSLSMVLESIVNFIFYFNKRWLKQKVAVVKLPVDVMI